MARKLKATARAKDTQLAAAVKDSAQQIWLAGLGAYAKAQDEGGKVFDALVREGTSIQKRTMKVTEDKVNEVTSKVTKAATLLNAKNRLCMSGTPLQNNTFDIFAQMNFLNPGLLGSMEYFRNEFATPIDKFGEQEQKEHLRKLLFPFILRRTKEQVAKDLPEKTETILFCEMSSNRSIN